MELEPLPIQFVKGVGPFRAQILKKVGIVSPDDLLTYFPRTHQDRRPVSLKSLKPGDRAAVTGYIQDVNIQRVGKMLGQARVEIKIDEGNIRAIWFKRLSFKYDVFSAIKRDITPGKNIVVYGEVAWEDDRFIIRAEDYEMAQSEVDSIHANRIVPIYPLTEGLQDRFLRTLIHDRLLNPTPIQNDPIPASVRNKYDLWDYDTAIRHYHYPNNWSERDQARHRLAFDEFFFLELALAINRTDQNEFTKSFSCLPKRHLLTPFKNSIGFDFTKGQTHAINEIFRDMSRPSPMNRLLQGDVGSGKTLVALSAALLAIENNCQVAFLAPTEILASQHYLSIKSFFQNLNISVALLTGATPKNIRGKTLSHLKSGQISLLVGTHAILNDDVEFSSLGLVVIDEQHRFGVRQREKISHGGREGKLVEKSHPHILIMTATPIPRTLALTLYGDLDISIIDELPPGRVPIETVFRSENEALVELESAIKKGQQAYMVFPLVEQSEKLSQRNGREIKAATKEFDRLKQYFSKYRLGLLHGQLSADEKKEIMEKFRSHQIDLLVSTPVIEVGIDVPNASYIAIVNPERFGLAQLHQLRGRVGRGKWVSRCILVQPNNEGRDERLITFSSTANGFKLAEEDLKLRGPGEFLGESQHGLPFFRVGDLIHDGLIIAQARQAAQDLVSGLVSMTYPESTLINSYLQRKFGNRLRLSKVG